MSELNEFVRSALADGAARDEVAGALEGAGWAPDEVQAALNRYAEVDFPVPVPRPHRSGTAKEAFLYLATFVTLYMSAISLGIVLTSIVDFLIPDPIYDPYAGSEWQLEAMLGNVASIIVALPIYVLLTRSHIRRYPTDPDRRGSLVRRWLTYMTMFAAFSVVLSALVMTVFNVLTGELVGRFVLKVLLVVAIAAVVFLFYQWELKLGEEEE